LEVEEVVQSELEAAALKKKLWLQSKSTTPGGSSTTESNPFVDLVLLSFQKFIQRWEPKFEKWDRLIENRQVDAMEECTPDLNMAAEDNLNPKESDIVGPSGSANPAGDVEMTTRTLKSDGESNSERSSCDKEPFDSDKEVRDKGDVQDVSDQVVGVVEPAVTSLLARRELKNQDSKSKALPQETTTAGKILVNLRRDEVEAEEHADATTSKGPGKGGHQSKLQPKQVLPY
jgi:hypothetical protein